MKTSVFYGRRYRPTVRRISPRLKGQPRAKLDPAREIRSYVRNLKTIRGESAHRLICEFARGLVFKGSTRTVVAIPAHVQEPNLLRSLKTYLQDPAGLVRTHIVLFLNSGPELSLAQHRQFLQLQMAELTEFRRANPSVALTVFAHRFRKSKMGEIRGLMTDAIACAADRAELKNLVVISNDADQISVSKNYLSKIQSYFARAGSPDAAKGGGLWGSPDLHRKLPELWVNMKIRKSRQLLTEDADGLVPARIDFWGINSFFRLEIYCAVGGYDYGLVDAEDIDLGCAIETMRTTQNFWFHGFFGVAVRQFNEACVASDPRRILRGILKNQVAAQGAMWTNSQPAAQLELGDLIQRYQKTRAHLQPRDFTASARGDLKARAKIDRKIKAIFLESIRRDPYFNPEHLEALAKGVGVKIENAKWKKRARGFPTLIRADIDVSQFRESYKFR